MKESSVHLFGVGLGKASTSQCTLSVRPRLEHGRFLTLEDATDRLSRKFGKELPLLAA